MTADTRWKDFTTEELHAIARGFDVADSESRGAWAGYQGFERP